MKIITGALCGVRIKFLIHWSNSAEGLGSSQVFGLQIPLMSNSVIT